MDLDVVPEPSDEERAAIAAALEGVLPPDEASAARGAWWAAGVAENLDEDD